jgi:hypothetical protein
MKSRTFFIIRKKHTQAHEFQTSKQMAGRISQEYEPYGTAINTRNFNVCSDILQATESDISLLKTNTGDNRSDEVNICHGYFIYLLYSERQRRTLSVCQNV